MKNIYVLWIDVPVYYGSYACSIIEVPCRDLQDKYFYIMKKLYSLSEYDKFKEEELKIYNELIEGLKKEYWKKIQNDDDNDKLNNNIKNLIDQVCILNNFEYTKEVKYITLLKIQTIKNFN